VIRAWNASRPACLRRRERRTVSLAGSRAGGGDSAESKQLVMRLVGTPVSTRGRRHDCESWAGQDLELRPTSPEPHRRPAGRGRWSRDREAAPKRRDAIVQIVSDVAGSCGLPGLAPAVPRSRHRSPWPLTRASSVRYRILLRLSHRLNRRRSRPAAGSATAAESTSRPGDESAKMAAGAVRHVSGRRRRRSVEEPSPSTRFGRRPLAPGARSASSGCEPAPYPDGVEDRAGWPGRGVEGDLAAGGTAAPASSASGIAHDHEHRPGDAEVVEGAALACEPCWRAGKDHVSS